VIEDWSSDVARGTAAIYEHVSKVKLIIRRAEWWLACGEQARDRDVLRRIRQSLPSGDDDCDPRLIERLVYGNESQSHRRDCLLSQLIMDKDGHGLGDDYAVREPSFRARCTTDTLLTRKR